MCGITGFWSPRATGTERTTIERMTAALVHRGPDSSGTWHDGEAGFYFGHRRLAVLDLSPAGHQPMVSGCGRYVLTYNGEIYNHRELRVALERDEVVAWRGHSDTETLLVAIARWGLAATLPRLNGMFAFAVWDKLTRTLSLARDRFGEKPLYFGTSGGVLMFGSELRALRCHPAFDGRLERASVVAYLARNACPTTASVYHGIRQVPPAHWIEIGDPGRLPSQATCYWDRPALAAAARTASAADGDLRTLVDELETTLGDAVARRLIADVPVGAFLSGGYDSSLIAALMQRAAGAPVNTFTIGFEQAAFDEAPYAAAVATHLQTHHTELMVTTAMARELVPELPRIWDEPFADSSQIPTCLLAQMTRSAVTVALSGDGADELFAGYRRYVSTLRTWARLNAWPCPLRGVAAVGARAFGSGVATLAGVLPAPLAAGLSQPADGLARMADLLELRDAAALYDYKCRHWRRPHELVIGATALPFGTGGTLPATPHLTLDTLLQHDAGTYLPEDILVKVDRAAMAVSLETRIPFLDPAVAALSWRLPAAARIHDGSGKWLVRELAHRHIPSRLLARPKQGFSMPIEAWLRGPLAAWADDLLNESRLRRQGLLHAAPIQRTWREFKRGYGRRHKLLWDVLMLQAWLEYHHDGQASFA